MTSTIKEWWAPLGLLLAVLTPVGTAIHDNGDMRGAIKAQEQRMALADRRADQAEQKGKEMEVDLRDQGRQVARMEAKIDMILERMPARP